MIKLIVSDLDGTLFDSSHTLPKENADAIRNAQHAGIIFMVATGRSIENITPLFAPYGLNCSMIVMNGSQFIDENKNVVKEVVMPADDTAAVLECMLHYGLNTRIYTDHGLVCTDPERMKKEFKERLRIQENKTDAEIESIMEAAEFSQYDMEIKDVQEFMRLAFKVYKIEAFSNDENILTVRKILGRRPSLALSNSLSDNIEVTNMKAQKGYMLEYVCEFLSLKKEEVVTLGDSMNDLSMMQMFSNSYAMDNAVPAIKKAARWQTLSNDAFGVAKVINDILKKQVSG